LGCGSNKIASDWIGIDILEESEADLKGDALSILKKIPDNSVAKLYSKHFLEHVPSSAEYFQEIERILERDAEAIIIVPHFSSPFYYSDPTHKIFFGLYTFQYLCKNSFNLRRKVPTYSFKSKLEVVQINLIFDSIFLPFKFFAILATTLVNSTNLFKEIYEGYFCWVCPCHEIKVIIKKSI
jgi:hypothetical protein